MNNQSIEKKIKSSENYLEVAEIFFTIQGEGPYTGFRAIFVRLAGCNLQCPGCDTDYTTTRKKMQIIEVLQEINNLSKETNCNLVVITGGEPFRQNITKLSNTLFSYGFIVQVETNGTLPPSEGLTPNTVIVCSPKTGSINYKLLPRILYFKYVLHADHIAEDGLPTNVLDHNVSSQVARPPKGDQRLVFLQPMDCKDEAQNLKNMDAVRDSCLKHGHVLQLQVHKIVGVE